MKDTDYAFCVARLRANEKYLLTNADISKLIDSDDYDSAIKFLASKGWIESESDASDCIAAQNKKLWDLLSESVPDKKELDVLCVLNDYFNIKAAVKCLLTGSNLNDYFIYPTTLDPIQLAESINKHNFDKIGGKKGECALQAYTVANKTENGQNAEIIIDKETINCMNEYAAKYSNQLISDIYAFVCDTSNIKIALRCAICQKSKDFTESAIGKCCNLDSDELIKHTLNGKESLIEYLSKSIYRKGIEIYNENPSSFDKWCDDEIINKAKTAKFKSFGFDPVCAYYYAKVNEIKTVNIILSGLLYAADKNTIKERVRELYV